jgi:predicted DCC family thiol-disulfide oxidoreductase YuxK
MLLLWDRERRLYPQEIQSAGGQLLLADVAPSDRLRAAHLVTADGSLLSGAAAAPELFRALRFGSPLAALCAGLMPVTAAAYHVLTRLRGVIGSMLPDAWCTKADGLIADRRRGITPPTSAR